MAAGQARRRHFQCGYRCMREVPAVSEGDCAYVRPCLAIRADAESPEVCGSRADCGPLGFRFSSKAVHTCEPWVNIHADTYTQFLQSCAGERGYTNTILVDSLGRIISIEQVLDDSGNILSLQLRED